MKLRELCTIQSGGTPSRSKPEFWENGSIPWVKISDIDGKYVSHTEEKITECGLLSSSAKVFPKGTLLYTIFATLGEVCILDIDAATNQAIAGITIKNDNVDEDYLFYFLTSLKTYVNRIGRGVAQNNINMSILREIEVPLPSIVRQKRIADILGKADQLIEKKERQLITLDELVKSRFIELFDNTTYDSNKVYLDEISDFVTVGIANSATHAYAESGVVMLRNQNIKENYLDENDLIYITPDFAKKYGSKKLVENDILVIRTGYPGIACLVPKKYEGCQTFTTLIVRLKAPTLAHANYVCHYINSSFGKDYVEQSKVGVAQQNFGAKALARMPILIPPMEIQEQFAAFVFEVDKSKLAVKQSLEKLETLKKSLMQQYFG